MRDLYQPWYNMQALAIIDQATFCVRTSGYTQHERTTTAKNMGILKYHQKWGYLSWPGIEPGTCRLLGGRDNHQAIESPQLTSYNRGFLSNVTHILSGTPCTFFSIRSVV
jgi:hypothetical protein